jgi:hypothetical protein
VRVEDQKWQIKAKPTWHYFGGKISWFKPKKKEKSLKQKVMISKAKMQVKVQLKHSICFNESKLVIRNLELGPHLKWPLIC